MRQPKGVRLFSLCGMIFFLLCIVSGCGEQYDAKPVVYLYPETTSRVTVRLDYDGQLTCTYPAYEKGWQVIAQPDGALLNEADGKEYSYLFWEGRWEGEYDTSEGFVVKGSDSAAFLQDILPQLGLVPKEYNEFIVYWLPVLQENSYNLITFQQEAYTSHASLEITPSPDTLIRVFMAYRPLEKPIEVPTPQFPTVERKGFTVVEWGGARID